MFGCFFFHSGEKANFRTYLIGVGYSGVFSLEKYWMAFYWCAESSRHVLLDLGEALINNLLDFSILNYSSGL